MKSLKIKFKFFGTLIFSTFFKFKRIVKNLSLSVLVSSFLFPVSANAASCVFSSSTSGLNTIVLITTTGSCTFTVPSNVTSMKIEVWGAGGGSMGQDNTTGAGAGGAFALSNISTTPNSILYISVGAGGIGSQLSGTAGGDTWVNLNNSAPTDSSTGALAKGGPGAPVASPNNSTQRALSIGTTIYIGGAGGTGAEGGGGAGASSFGNGGNGAVGNGGAGGSSPSAGAGGSAGGTTLNGGDGISNVEGGGGGGGSYNNRGGMGGAPGGAGGAGYTNSSVNPSSGVNTNTVHGYGGDGGRGQVRLTYQTAPDTTPPSFVSSNSFSVAENLSTSATAASIKVSESATVTISSGSDSSLFNISKSDSVTALIKFKTSPDYEAPIDSGANNVYDLTLTTTDDAGNSATQSITITVTNVLDTSSFNSLTISGMPIYRSSVTITADVSVAAKVTFKAGNVVIAGCKNLSANGSGSSFTVNCSWKPSTRGNVLISAIATPTSGAISGTTCSPVQVNVTSRTGSR